MTSFQYSAIDAQGKAHKGSINADSSKQARLLLRQKNLIPMEVSEHSSSNSASSGESLIQRALRGELKGSFNDILAFSFMKNRGISKKMLCLVTRQLATLVKASLPITEVLAAVSEQNAHPQTRSVMLSVKAKVLEGHSLASALREHPKVFTALYCGIVASGEKAGNLAKVLERLADYTEQQYKLKQKILHALIYPISLIVVSLCIIIFLLDYVVPKMITVYSHLHQALPLLTQILLGLSQGIRTFGIYLALASIFGIWAFRSTLKKKPEFRESFHRFLLRIPLLGKSIQTINTARYSRTLAMLSSSGVPILDGMTAASALISHLPIRQALIEAAQQVREGAAIHLALKKTSYFSPLSLHLIASGEASGELETLLEHTALQQEEEISRLIDTLLTLFEPALILVMGGMVLFIVLAVLLPIFDLNQLNM